MLAIAFVPAAETETVSAPEAEPATAVAPRDVPRLVLLLLDCSLQQFEAETEFAVVLLGRT